MSESVEINVTPKEESTVSIDVGSSKTIETTDKPKLPVIYIGPSNSKLGLRRFGQYKGELNPHVKKAMEKFPALRILFVPLEEFASRAKAVYDNTDSTVSHAVEALVKSRIF